MCGPTAAQTNLQSEQADFYQEMTQEYSTVFGEDQGVLSELTKTFEPILAAGPSQEGFSAAEKNNLDSEAIQGTATNYAAAEKALREDQAAEGGGNTFSVAGQDTEQRGELASQAANQESSEEEQITQADYAQGQQNFDTAASALTGVASELNPAGFAGATTGAGSAAGTTADQIAQEQDSEWTPVLSALGGVAGAAAGNLNFGSGGWSYGSNN